MRSLFIAIAALLAATTQAVSIQILRKNHVREFARAQTTMKKVGTHKLFAQQFNFRLPKGELTHEQKEQIWNEWGLGGIDHNGDHKISFEEAISQLPAEWRSPEFDHEMRRQFDEIDTDKSGEVDIDEFINYYRKNVEPLLEAYESQMSSFADQYNSYAGSYSGSSWEGNSDWNNSNTWDSSYNSWSGDSGYEWNDSQYASYSL